VPESRRASLLVARESHLYMHLVTLPALTNEGPLISCDAAHISIRLAELHAMMHTHARMHAKALTHTHAQTRDTDSVGLIHSSGLEDAGACGTRVTLLVVHFECGPVYYRLSVQEIHSPARSQVGVTLWRSAGSVQDSCLLFRVVCHVSCFCPVSRFN
jgi:hypothetical protein